MRNDFLAFLKPGLLLVSMSCLFIMLFLLSCEEQDPASLGRELLPGSDDITVSFDSTEVIQAFTAPGDSVKTNEKSRQLLGSYADPLFGISRARFITQVEAPGEDSPEFGNDAVADTVFISLYIEDYYGFEETSHSITVYEYTDSLSYDTSYYSSFDPEGKYRPDPVGTGLYTPGDTVLTIIIEDEELINRFLTAEDTVFRNNRMFQEMFRGFYIETDAHSTDGSILYCNLSDDLSSLTFRYRNSVDTSSFIFNLAANYGVSVNVFDHEYSGYPVATYLSNKSENDSLLFIEAMGGVKSIIRFPELEAWRDTIADDGPIAINNAELFLYPASTAGFDPGKENYPDRLNLFWIDEEGLYRVTHDYLLSQETFGGTYDQDRNCYNFQLKIHLQSYLQGTIADNPDLILNAAGNATTANRVVINGGEHSSGLEMRLEISYTKL